MESSAVSIPGKAATRAAVPADVPALAEVAARSYAHGFRGILSDAELATRDPDSFRQRFTESLDRMTVLDLDGRVAGFAMVTDGHIDMFFLDPAVAGRGLGVVLLDRVVMDGARSLECFADNHPARRFYERGGWQCVQDYSRTYNGREMAFVRYALPDRNETS